MSSTRTRTRSATVLLSVTFVLLCSQCGNPPAVKGLELPQAAASYPEARFEVLFKEHFFRPRGLAKSGDKYFVSDNKANRVLIFDQEQELERTIGSIGSGEGELLRPNEIAVTVNGSLYVRDFGNDRIQVFDSRGATRAQIPVYDYVGLAATKQPTKRPTVIVGQPGSGSLVTVYDLQGRVVRRFGALRTAKDLYGTRYEERGDDDLLLLNRVHLVTDTSGSIYATFLFAPLVQKYSAEGELVWETTLVGPLVDQLADLFIRDEGRRGHKFVRTVQDGRAANYVTLGSAVDPISGKIYVLLPSRTMLVLGRDGQQQGAFRLVAHPREEDSILPSDMGYADNGEIGLIDIFNARIWRGKAPL